MLTVTDKAAEKIKTLMSADGRDLSKEGLRVGVTGGGCSGMSYIMDFDSAREGDKVFSNGGVRVIVDPKSMTFMDGSILDYIESLQGAGFTVKNPKSTGSCGCGSSFSV